MNFKRALCAFNLLILFAFSMVVVLMIDQIRPSCPAMLFYLPLLGSVSAIATVALLILLARSHRDEDSTLAMRLRRAFDVLCVLLFVPYLLYWNLIGFHF